MQSWAKWTAKAVLVTTGFAAAGGGFAGVAYAGTGGSNAGNLSSLSGDNVQVPITGAVNVCGNAVAVLGGAIAGCEGGASVGGSTHGSASGGGSSIFGGSSAGSNDSSMSPPQQAALGALPGMANLPTLAGADSLVQGVAGSSSGLSGATSVLPAGALSAYSTSAGSGGMSSDSFLALAIGALLAGAAALKLAGRRSRIRKANGEAPA